MINIPLSVLSDGQPNFGDNAFICFEYIPNMFVQYFSCLLGIFCKEPCFFIKIHLYIFPNVLSSFPQCWMVLKTRTIVLEIKPQKALYVLISTYILKYKHGKKI